MINVTRVGMKLHIPFVVVVVSLVLCHSAYAASRNCTADEKSQANMRLLAISDDNDDQANTIKLHMPFGLHKGHEFQDSELVLYQDGYILKYDKDLRTTLWVSYKLTSEDVTNAKGKDRVNCFRRDPRLKYQDASTPADYKEPIYDQGHMANDADLKDELLQQVNTYIMSNMSPQHCRLNRGIWLSLEHLTRKWAGQYTNIYVTSGAIFDRNGDAKRDANNTAMRMASNSGKSRVAVPSHYYKVILRKEDQNWYAITFLLENKNMAHGAKWADIRGDAIYAITTIGVIEELTGDSLHPNLNRNTLIQNTRNWDLSRNKANFESSCR